MTVIAHDVSPRPAGSRLRGGQAADPQAFSWPMVFFAWAVIAAIAIGLALHNAGITPLINDTDDAMRLTTVHDLLAGQSWWDHIQHRLNAPFGAEIHWSHLVDAPIAGLILLARPFFGPLADTIAVYIWPLLLLLALLALCARLTWRLAGPGAILPALVLPALSPALMSEFSPGRIDHHSIQILMTLLMVWGVIESIHRPRFALLAGVAAAFSLAVGVEGLPSVVSALLALSLIWVARPERADALRGFGLSFAAGTVLALIDQYPPSRWLEPACDEISFTYAAFAVGTGLALTLLSVLPLGARPAWQRLALGGVLGGALAVALAKAFPLCATQGPYGGLDPWLVHNWLDHISEAKPIWESFGSAGPFTLAVSLPPLLGLVVILARLVGDKREDRTAWLVLGAFLLVAVVVMGAQIRGARLAAPLAVPAAGWLITVARQRFLSGRRISGALALIGSWLSFAGLVVGAVGVLLQMPFDTPAAAAQNDASRDACVMPGAFSALAKLPPARLMAPVDLGSHLLLFTPHSVVGAPYQRDQAGIFDTYRFLNGPSAEARQILARRGVTLVVVCPGMPELRGLPDAAADSFVKVYAAGRLPAWLTPLDTGGTLRLYAVAPQ